MSTKAVGLRPLSGFPKILVIRRDNIGDLVCTTPIFRALRERYPAACIAALVNSYTWLVLENNPDIDRVFAYTKAKHRAHGISIFRIYWERLRLILRLRRMRFDYVILAAPGFLPRVLRLARLIRARHIVGFTDPARRGTHCIDMGVDYLPPHPRHETEDVFRVLAPLGIHGPPPPARVMTQPDEVAMVEALIRWQGWPTGALRVAVHISARKPGQRWAAERFIELVKCLHRMHSACFVLLWSPGDEKNPLHPGDAAKAREIIGALEGVPVTACPTHQLRRLIAALSLCDCVVCSDGGAMHLAAALGKPILCFFGNSDSVRWHPWRVPHVLLQPATLNVADISVDEAVEGFQKLLAAFNRA